MYNYLQSPRHVQFSYLSKTPPKNISTRFSNLKILVSVLNSPRYKFSSVSSLNCRASKFYSHQFYSAQQQLSSILVSWIKKVLIMLIMRNYSTTNKLKLRNDIRNPTIHNKVKKFKVFMKRLSLVVILCFR